MTIPPITLEQVRDDWRACYPPDRLAALYPVPRTPLEVLTRTDGPWADVPAKDRLWTLTRPGALPDRIQRLFACDCARRVLAREREAGCEPDPRSCAAIDVAERHARGEATDAELSAAYTAADAASYADAAGAAAAAADTYYAIDAADANYAADMHLSDFAERVVQILIDMDAPGCAFLHLTEAA